MILTPFLIMVFAGFAAFIGTIGFVSVWSHGANDPKTRPSTARPAQPDLGTRRPATGR